MAKNRVHLKESPELRVKLSKEVCFHCLVRAMRTFDIKDSDMVIAERMWKEGRAPCDGTKRTHSIYESPKSDCPYIFEHGVAAAQEDSDE